MTIAADFTCVFLYEAMVHDMNLVFVGAVCIFKERDGGDGCILRSGKKGWF